jgi:hypothetical protein
MPLYAIAAQLAEGLSYVHLSNDKNPGSRCPEPSSHRVTVVREDQEGLH